MSHAWLVLGLLVFLGGHSLRVFAPAWRDARVAAMGEKPFKAVYSLVAIAGFVLLVWGYAQARGGEPVLLWVPPLGLRHAVSLLTLPAFILLVAAYLPGNHFKARLGHPMLLAVKLWALAHLLVNGWLHGVLLFGGFLLWAIVCFRAARRRAPAPGGGRWLPTIASVVLGAVLWAGFVFHLHKLLIGVAPFG